MFLLPRNGKTSNSHLKNFSNGKSRQDIVKKYYTSTGQNVGCLLPKSSPKKLVKWQNLELHFEIWRENLFINSTGQNMGCLINKSSPKKLVKWHNLELHSEIWREKLFITSTGQNMGCLINKSYSIDIVIMSINSQGSGLSKSIVDVYVTIIGTTQNFVTICTENNDG